MESSEAITVLSVVTSIVISLGVYAVLIAVAVDFFKFHRRVNTVKEKRSIVATGTMLFFLFVFYLLVRFHISEIALPAVIRIPSMILGAALVVFGAFVNIRGRLILKTNWSNHIKIYDDHQLVCGDVFAWVRHPLYASLMAMFYGASLAYLNAAAFLATSIIFIPFMWYRARQEEVLLNERFPSYKDYQRNVGMFFPKIKRSVTK